MFRRALALLLFCVVAVVTAEVHANYTETHLAGVDVHVSIERDGRAVVTHQLRYRVMAGAMRSLSIASFEEDWHFRSSGTVTSSDGRALGTSIIRDDKGVVRVTVDDPKGLKRGDYTFELVYEGSLVGRRITRDGAFDRVRFALPPMNEGVDSVRVVLDLPSAPTEPQAMTDGDVAADLPTLRRSATRDELELTRPHAPKGEAATFFARVDPKALSLVVDPTLRAPVIVAPAEARASPPIAIAALAAVCALLLLALGLAKARVLAASSAVARGLVPIPSAVRVSLAAIAFGAAVFLEAQGRFTIGALAVAIAIVLAAWTIPATSRGPRKPSTWLVLKPEEAFESSRATSDWLDGTTRRGALSLAAFAFAIAIACAMARNASSAAPYVILIDAMILVPIFFTGTARQMPPSVAREAAALAPIARKLAARDELKIAPYARDDEMRLLVSPRFAMLGLSAIEIGVGWERAGGAILPSFDVLVRVHDGSFAAAKMTAAYPTKRALPGRKPEERVHRFEPEGPSIRAVTRLVCDLAETLRDKRIAIAKPVLEVDRRVPPNRKTLSPQASVS